MSQNNLTEKETNLIDAVFGNLVKALYADPDNEKIRAILNDTNILIDSTLPSHNISFKLKRLVIEFEEYLKSTMFDEWPDEWKENGDMYDKDSMTDIIRHHSSLSDFIEEGHGVGSNPMFVEYVNNGISSYGYSLNSDEMYDVLENGTYEEMVEYLNNELPNNNISASTLWIDRSMELIRCRIKDLIPEYQG